MCSAIDLRFSIIHSSSGTLFIPSRLAVVLFVTSASDRFFDSFIVYASFFVLNTGDFSFFLGVEVKLPQGIKEFSHSKICRYEKLSIE